MAAVDAQNLAIPGAIHTKMGEDLSEMSVSYTHLTLPTILRV